MQLKEEEFNEQFSGVLDTIIETLAENPEVEPTKFYSMVCILENLQFFAPVIFSALKKKPQE